MPDEPEAEQADDAAEPRKPGSVPSEGRTISKPAPTPAAAFTHWLNEQLGRTR